MPRSSSGHEWLLVVSDHFTKFVQAFPVRNTSAEMLARKVMDEYICRFGCFENLHSDQGANVDSKKMIISTKLCRIKDRSPCSCRRK